MNLRHLEIYKVVCKHMNITKAAEELYMSQPAVSIVIKELEDYYETKLFDRMSRKLFLTESGIKLLSYTHSILKQIDLSIKDIRDEQNLDVCNIGANVTIGEGYLSDMITHLNNVIPELNVHVCVDNVASLEKRLISNEFDYVITDTPQLSLQLMLEKLGGEPMLLVCSPDFTSAESLTMRELAEYPLLLREKGSGCRRVVDAIFEQNECFMIPKIESISHISLIELAKGGHGIAIIPRVLVRKELVSNELKTIELTDASFIRNYYIVYHYNKYLSPLVKQSMEEIKSLFKTLIHE